MSLEQCGDPKKLPGGYKLQLACQDCTYYLPIGLRNFKSVEINGHTGVSGEITVSGSPPCCFGLCGLLGVSTTALLLLETMFRCVFHFYLLV